MSSDTDWRRLLPPPVRRMPADLVAVIVVVALTNLAVIGPIVRETPVRVVFSLPFVLFVPGYAVIAALFPEAREPQSETGEQTRVTVDRNRGIKRIERVALSFGVSIAIVPPVGLVLNLTQWGIRLVPVLVSVSAFTLLATAVAAERRRALPRDERFRVPYRAWIAAGRSGLLEPETRTDAILNVVLVLSLLLAIGSVGFAIAVPKTGEAFTEFYILTENETGELVAADYPSEFTQGDSEEIVTGVVNQEHQPETYQVVVELHRVERANNSTRILEREELSQFATGELAHNETWIRRHNVSPTMTGERLRLTYMLYRGDVPAEPTPENAYRELHLWVNVTEAENGSAVHSLPRAHSRSDVRSSTAAEDGTATTPPRVRVGPSPLAAAV